METKKRPSDLSAVNLIKYLNGRRNWHGKQYRSLCGEWLRKDGIKKQALIETMKSPNDTDRDSVEIRGRLREMEGDLHHSDLTLSNQDRCAGEMMAYEIGDLFIDSDKQSPIEQWSKVMRALRAHGYEAKKILQGEDNVIKQKK